MADENEGTTAVISTVCPECSGSGRRRRLYGAITRREPGQMFAGAVDGHCPPCGGTGWLPMTTPVAPEGDQ